MDRPAPQQFPVRVAVVDVEDRPAALSALREDGTRWSGVWLVVRQGGTPVGVAEVPFDGADAIPREDVAARVTAVVAAAPARPDLSRLAGALPSASVIVPTNLARPQQLRAGLAALDALDHPDFEVVVVDNSAKGAADLLTDLVAGLSRVRVVREPVPGISAARNAGVRSARGEVIAFTDDDVQVDPGWLRALAGRLALRPDEDAATGLILPAELETPAQLWFERHYGGFGAARVFAPLTYRGAAGRSRLTRRAEVAVTDWEGAEIRRFALYGAGACGAGANMAFRADALRRLGPFDEALGTGTPARGGEDLAVFIRLLASGGSIGYEPRAVVHHTHRADYPSLRGQIKAYGLGFTAMLTSLVVAEPWHVGGVLSQLPRVARRALRGDPAATAAPAPVEAPLGAPAPRELVWLERWGALQGPGAYLRSRRRVQRRAHGAASVTPQRRTIHRTGRTRWSGRSGGSHHPDR
ncbi:glycosyltransferase [Geodermatophilus sp. SYSU D00758]